MIKFEVAERTALKFGYDVTFTLSRDKNARCKDCSLYCHCAVKNFMSKCEEMHNRELGQWYYIPIAGIANDAHGLIDYFMSGSYDDMVRMETLHG